MGLYCPQPTSSLPLFFPGLEHRILEAKKTIRAVRAVHTAVTSHPRFTRQQSRKKPTSSRGIGLEAPRSQAWSSPSGAAGTSLGDIFLFCITVFGRVTTGSIDHTPRETTVRLALLRRRVIWGGMESFVNILIPNALESAGSIFIPWDFTPSRRSRRSLRRTRRQPKEVSPRAPHPPTVVPRTGLLRWRQAVRMGISQIALYYQPRSTRRDGQTVRTAVLCVVSRPLQF